MPKSLWNIGTPEDPIIQGQDGLPFYHQPGGWRRFEKSSDSYSYVNNNCLCKCKNYLYYVHYIHMGDQKRRVYKSDSNHEILYNILTSDSVSGYVFKESNLMCISKYLPAGAFQTGVSFIPDLPYSQDRRDNITRPYPQYYKQNSPFGPATTIIRYINTYGSSDCGEPWGSDSVSGESGSGSASTCQNHWAQFYVYDLGYPDVDPYAQLISGSQGHSFKLPPPMKATMIDCHLARVLASIRSCEGPQIYMQLLKNFAITMGEDAARANLCVYWALYKINIVCCQQPPEGGWNSWERVESFAGVPDKVWGKGDGQGLWKWHNQDRVIVQRQTSVDIYQWVPGQDQEHAQPPSSPVTTNPCARVCSGHTDPDMSESSTGSDSIDISLQSYIQCSNALSCSKCLQPVPCNIMREFPYFYKAADVQFPQFTIWRRYTANWAQGWTSVESELYDWQLLPQWDSQWTQVFRDQQDEILYIDILVDMLDGYPSPQIEYDRLHQLWEEEQQTTQQQLFFATFKNYWQVYFNCGGTFGVCDPPRLVAHMISNDTWNSIAQSRGICLNKWQVATAANTFSSQGELPGKFVYTFSAPSDIFQLCYDLSKGMHSITVQGTGKYNNVSKQIDFPKKYLIMQVTTVEPGQILREDPLYIHSQIADYSFKTSYVYSSNSISNLNCQFTPLPPQGWYQEPQGIQGETLLQLTHWKNILPLSTMAVAHTDQDGVLAPGRKAAAEGQEGEAICRLYYLSLKEYGWKNVWTSDSNGVLCQHQDYIVHLQGNEDQPIEMEAPTVNWQIQCAKPTPYGLRVYIIGPSIFPGIQFPRSNLPSEITGIQTAYNVTGEVLVDLSQSSQESWIQKHGDRTIASGFYTANRSLPTKWFYNDSQLVVFPQYIRAVTFGLSPSNCVDWILDEKVQCPVSHYDTMRWRIYIAFGYKNGLNQVVGIRGVNGQNGTISRKVGFPLSFNTTRVCDPSYTNPALRLYATNSSTNIFWDYYNNKAPSIEIAPAQQEYIWPGDENSTTFNIPLGFLVPDPQGVGAFGTNLSGRGVDTTSGNYYWKQSISNQEYGSGNTPWWIFSMSDIPIFKSVSSRTCVIYQQEYVSVQQKVINGHIHARPSDELSQEGKSYIQGRLTASIIGGSGVNQVYASKYLVTGQYDSYDSKYAFQNGSTWINGLITEHQVYTQRIKGNWYNGDGSLIRPYYTNTDRTKDTTVSNAGLDMIEAQIQKTCSDMNLPQTCTSNSNTMTTHVNSMNYPQYFIRGNKANCASDSSCLATWYIYFDQFPFVLWSGYQQSYKWPQITMTGQNCQGRKKFALPTSLSNSTLDIQFTYHTESYVSNSGEWHGGVPWRDWTNKQTTKADYYFYGKVKHGAPPTSWFPIGASGLDYL